MGVINALGNTMGFIAPIVTGLITNHHNDIRHWQVGYKIILNLLAELWALLRLLSPGSLLITIKIISGIGRSGTILFGFFLAVLWAFYSANGHRVHCQPSQ
jgi:hypothetical protein